MEQVNNTPATATQAEQVSAMSREEYNTIKKVLERNGCDALIDAEGFFELLYGYSFTKFFANQPAIVSALKNYGAISATTAEGRAITAFIESLEKINTILFILAEGAHIVRQADDLTRILFNAYYDYEVNTRKNTTK